MKSATPKVLHTLSGRSMLGHAVAAASELSPERIAVVVRHAREQVAEHALSQAANILIVDQDEIPGTGRAVQCALSVLDATSQAQAAQAGVPDGFEGQAELPLLTGSVVVTAGDVPLLDGETLQGLLKQHQTEGNAVTVLTAKVADPTGYGRIIRSEDGQVAGIVEHKDASTQQLEINEVNTSIYVFEADVLREALGQVDRNNSQGEVYLTDVLALARSAGKRVAAQVVAEAITAEGANDRAQLSVLRAELNRRILTKWMLAGVTIIDPNTTWVDVEVELAQDVTLLPNTQLFGQTSVESFATIGPDTTLTDVAVGEGASIIRTHGSESVIGAKATVGPFAYLRPGTHLGVKGKIGTFVEAKNAIIGDGSKVPHLSYIGDAEVGEQSNIGAGSIFVNYDGVNKHRTTVGSHARTGANNLFVAPVNVADAVYTAAGSVIRRDVPAGSLAVSAGVQRNIEGWVERRRPGTAAAEKAKEVRQVEATPEAALAPQALQELARGETGAINVVSSPTDPEQPA